MFVLAIGDESTIAALDGYRDMLTALTDARATSEERARQLIGTAKPIYWITSGIHSPEVGGPEMLIELAYRLIVEETPFVQDIRRNVITFITPVLEVDGREKAVDTYYFNKRRMPGDARLPLMYWGQYVAHDDNRDGIGQLLALTKAVTRTTLEWHPTVIHDLHETQSYLYVSTGTGPYNPELDPIVIREWWTLAENDVLELTKRGVPGVSMYGYYDGWAPSYMFFIAHTHNAIGRFYEVQGYGPDPYEVRLDAEAISREWFGQNPPLPSIKWGPRNTTNLEESAVLFSLAHVAKNRESYLENYWLKNKRSVEKGRAGPVFAWVIPSGQRRKTDAAEAINDLRRQGLEISVATAAFQDGATTIAPGDFVIRADQPFRTLAAMYFDVQHYGQQNPRPYDDTGWTFQLLRRIELRPVTDKAILESPMTLLKSDARPRGGIEGAGPTLVVDQTSENDLVTFRIRNAAVKMFAAEHEFDVEHHHFHAGAVIIPQADRSTLEPMLRELGLSATAVATLPAIPIHELDVPRIGYVHSWTRTQDEGWWRAAFDRYGIPYTYFADQKLKEGHLREKFDVIVFPTVGGDLKTVLNGVPAIGSSPLPYTRTDATPHLGILDSSEDIRGGTGLPGLVELTRFVQEGGMLIGDGTTTILFSTYGIASGLTLEEPSTLFVRGSVLRAKAVDASSPLLYGHDGADVPVYFNQGPVISAGGETAERSDAAVEFQRAARLAGLALDVSRPRVVLQLPTNADEMLLSGSLANGQLLSNRVVAVDERLGAGHLVLFAMRPFWRWETQGSYFLVFNAILNWNDLGPRK